MAVEDGELVVSKIYGWFEEDFGGSERGMLRHPKAHAAPELALRPERFDGIDDHRYDRSLDLAEGC